MKLPELQDSERYVGLYVVDFGDHAGVGFTAEEVAELFESKRYKDCKAYKINNARPDGQIELRGVRRELFELEMGMFFYESDIKMARDDYNRLISLAVKMAPPSRAKVQLAKLSDDKYVTAMIYPAEYDSEVSQWLLDGDYNSQSQAEGGFSVVKRYYESGAEILETHQLFGKNEAISRSGEELLAGLKRAVQR